MCFLFAFLNFVFGSVFSFNFLDIRRNLDAGARGFEILLEGFARNAGLKINDDRRSGPF